MGWLRAISPTHNWFNFCLLVLALYVACGVALIGLIPPLEGWDEYQHLAYFEHLRTEGTAPVLGKATVSRELLREAAAYPQSQSMVSQTGMTGAVEYETFWSAGPPKYVAGHPEIPLYQAQHGSLYYRLLSPIYRWAGGVNNLPRTIAALRLTNLCLGLLTLIVVMRLVTGLIPDRTIAGLLLLVMSLQPLVLWNVVRVANDALAIALGTIVVIWCLGQGSHPTWKSIVVGAALGSAALTKATCLALFPFVVASGLAAAWFGVRPWRKAFIDAGLVVGMGLLVLAPTLLDSLAATGTLTTMQESVANKASGKSTAEVLQAGLQLDLVTQFTNLWFQFAVFVGGWSMVILPASFGQVYYYASLFGGLGWCVSLIRRRCPELPPTSLPSISALAVSSAALLGCVSLALFWHMAHSSIRWGVPSTCPWYAAIATPILLLFVLLGALQYGRIIGILAGLTLAGTFGSAMVCGLISCVPRCAQATGWEAISRLSSLQPVWLNGSVTTAALIVAAGTGILLLIGWCHGQITPGSIRRYTLRWRRVPNPAVGIPSGSQV